jgi:hypothetical protein
MMNTASPSVGQTSTSIFQQSGGNAGSLSNGGSSTGSSSASSTSSNNPWSYVDAADTETFLQDILSGGYSSNKQSRNVYSDFSTNGDSSSNFPSGNTCSSHGFGINNVGGINSSSGNIGGTNSLGLSGNFGAFGNLNSGTSTNTHNSSTGGGLFGSPLDENVGGSNIKMMDRIGSHPMSPGSGGQSVGATNTEKYQHRVLVAN